VDMSRWASHGRVSWGNSSLQAETWCHEARWETAGNRTETNPTQLNSEGVSWRFLGRDETADPRGARPNRSLWNLQEARVGRLAKSRLKQKEG